MWKYRPAMPILLGLCFIALADCAPEAMTAASEAQIPAIKPGTARVWFLRPSSPPNGNIEESAPMIFANGAPVADIPAGADFFHDFPPGTYGFTVRWMYGSARCDGRCVQPYGLMPGQPDTVQLAAGTQTYLQVGWIASREEGDPEVSRRFAPNTFGVLTISPQVAQANLTTMTYLGQR
jgi:hypothetical protein